MEKKNLKEVSIEELISYSKQKDTPAENKENQTK